MSVYRTIGPLVYLYNFKRKEYLLSASVTVYNNTHSLCILTFNLVIFHFGFEGGIWTLIDSVPGHCILVTFYNFLSE